MKTIKKHVQENKNSVKILKFNDMLHIRGGDGPSEQGDSDFESIR
jgi:hypothetical protein